jgi:hypothetical protein
MAAPGARLPGAPARGHVGCPCTGIGGVAGIVGSPGGGVGRWSSPPADRLAALRCRAGGGADGRGRQHRVKHPRLPGPARRLHQRLQANDAPAVHGGAGEPRQVGSAGAGGGVHADCPAGPPVARAQPSPLLLPRSRYWARSFAGWGEFAHVKPNAAHEALARLQRNGWVGACRAAALPVTAPAPALSRSLASQLMPPLAAG